MQRLGAGALLFLRQVEEIEWRVEGGPSGLYCAATAGRPRRWRAAHHRHRARGRQAGYRGDLAGVFQAVITAAGVRRARLNSRSRSVKTRSPTERGFALSPHLRWSCSFPTVLETHLGFLSRVPIALRQAATTSAHDAWKPACVHETAGVLVERAKLAARSRLSRYRCTALPAGRSREVRRRLDVRAAVHATKRALATEPFCRVSRRPRPASEGQAGAHAGSARVVRCIAAGRAVRRRRRTRVAERRYLAGPHAGAAPVSDAGT